MNQALVERIEDNLQLSWSDHGWLGKAYRDDITALLTEIRELESILRDREDEGSFSYPSDSSVSVK